MPWATNSEIDAFAILCEITSDISAPGLATNFGSPKCLKGVKPASAQRHVGPDHREQR